MTTNIIIITTTSIAVIVPTPTASLYKHSQIKIESIYCSIINYLILKTIV